MFPEVISNGLASLQEENCVTSSLSGSSTRPTCRRGMCVFNAAIRNHKRFTYDEVQSILEWMGSPDRQAEGSAAFFPEGRSSPGASRSPSPHARPRHFSSVRSGSSAGRSNSLCPKPSWSSILTAAFPERTSQRTASATRSSRVHACGQRGGRRALHTDGCTFPSPVHPAPNEEKLEAFAQFAELLGYPIRRPQDRFELQRVLHETADKPERAVRPRS